jgi:hypothetical protein
MTATTRSVAAMLTHRVRVVRPQAPNIPAEPHRSCGSRLAAPAQAQRGNGARGRGDRAAARRKRASRSRARWVGERRDVRTQNQAGD